MGLITIVVIAVGLAADAFAVSVVSGAAYKRLEIRHAFRIASFFGGFQAFMPVIGYLAAKSMVKYIAGYGHWIAFGLLLLVGSKMIYESFKIKSAGNTFDPSSIVVLLVLAIATSIDALAIGITLSIIKSSIIIAVLIIGLVTFILSYIGVFLGKKLEHFFESGIEAIGGIILIAIGIKILSEHLLL